MMPQDACRDISFVFTKHVATLLSQNLAPRVFARQGRHAQIVCINRTPISQRIVGVSQFMLMRAMVCHVHDVNREILCSCRSTC
jgi:hypothetical protein